MEGRLEAHRHGPPRSPSGRTCRLAREDLREPDAADHEGLLRAVAIPTARAKSKITGEHIDKPEWGPNWDDDLGGSMETLDQDPVLHQMNLQVAKTIEDAYMFYLPRIC